jgi:Ca2+:H+ antiporter
LIGDNSRAELVSPERFLNVVRFGKLWILARAEWFLGISAATSLAFLFYGELLFSRLSSPLWLAVTLVWLFAAIMGSAISVVRHADRLAIRLGEPYGTLILTLAVTSIEVMSISAVMLHGANNPTLVRDTLLAVVMMILNGMVGLSLLFGGWRHHEQHYNFQGANTYLGVIIPLTVLSLILPNFLPATAGSTLPSGLAVILVLVSIVLYSAFLAVQTGRHRAYFMSHADEGPAGGSDEHAGRPPLVPHPLLLVAYMVPVVFLAEQLARPVDYLIETLGAPVAIGGLIIAVLTATPEAIGATKAALANRLQRSMNIFLGSVLSTIGLTIPAMLVISHLAGREIVLGLQGTDFVMLLLTLAVSAVTFASGRTNVLQGLMHLALFATYVLLMFER